MIEGNKRGIKSKFFIDKNHKYNCSVTNPKNSEYLKNLSKIYNFSIFPINEIKTYPGITFLIEGVGRKNLTTRHTSVSLTYMSDYRVLYETYMKEVDYIIFPNKKFAEEYGTISPKNLYFGCTKYDLDYSRISRKSITNKYSLDYNKKFALIIYPKSRDLSNFFIKNIIDDVRKIGLTPILKHRGKENILNSFGCVYFGDFSWYPHTTLELMNISDVVINTSSTSIKESIMMNKPIVNFSVKPHKRLSFLYNYDFVTDFQGYNKKDFETALNEKLYSNYDLEFEKCKQEVLFNLGTSSRILDYLKK